MSRAAAKAAPTRPLASRNRREGRYIGWGQWRYRENERKRRHQREGKDKEISLHEWGHL